MPGRKYSAAIGYRYGFNGKENDNEVKGEGNQQDYGMRIYDPRLMKFLSVDPLSPEYPELTTYQFASNRPIDGIDRDGLEYEPSMAADKIRVYEDKLRKEDPENAEQIIRQHKITAFIVVATPFTLGWGTSALAAGTLTRLTVTTSLILANPANQLMLSSAAGFTLSLLNPDPNGTPFNFPGSGDEIGTGLRNLFKSPVNVSGLFKNAGVQIFKLISGTNEGKTAIVGSDMSKVLKVASGLKNAEVFRPTTDAINEWEGLKKLYNNSIPKAKEVGSKLFKENTQWINDVKKQGYDILDVGGGTSSPFYNLEKEAIYGASK